MKLKSKFLVLLLAVVFVFTMFAMAACGDDEVEEVSISLSQKTVSLVVGGGKATINATVKGTNKNPEWKVGSSSVATIRYEGTTCEITPVAKGSTNVTATVEDKTAICTVTVTEEGEAEVTITLSQSTLSLKAGEAAKTVTATVAGSTENVTWSLANGDDAVVTITPNGNTVSVNPIAEGTATLTAKIGSVTKTCSITVAPADIPVEIALAPATLNLQVGKAAQTVTATVTGTNENVMWSVGSGEEAYVSLESHGNSVSVTPIAAGTATLTAAIGEIQATCAITIIPETTISLAVEDGDKVELEYDETAEEAATATVTATVANTDENVVWSINSDIADITPSADGKTCTVTAAGVGRATLKATVDGKTATIPVVIAPAEGAEVSGELTISIEEESVVLEKGETLDISAIVKGSVVEPTWSVSAEGVVELSKTTGEEITLTAVAGGTVTLTVTIGEGENETVTLTIGVVALTLDKTNVILFNDENDEEYSAVITATVEPADQTVVWTVSDDEVLATVINGNSITVTANGVGTATITAKLGTIVKTVTITVKAPVSLSLSSSKLNMVLDYTNTQPVEVYVEGTDDDIEFEVTGDTNAISVFKTFDGGHHVIHVNALAVGSATVVISVGGKSISLPVTVSEMVKITAWETVDNAIYGESVDGVRGDVIWHHLYLNDVDAKQYDFDGYIASVTVDGKEGVIFESQDMTDGDISAHAYHLHLHIEGNRYQTTVFTIYFKKDGEVVAIGTYTRVGDRELVLDSALANITVNGTETVSITSINGSNNFDGKTISWSIEDSSIATIPDGSNGTSVVVTGVAAGTTTLTCTVGEGEDAITKTCTITVGAGPVEATDISAQYNFNNKFSADGDCIQVYFNLQGADFALLAAQIDPSKTAVEVAMDKEESAEADVLRKEWQAANLYNLWVQVRVKSDWTHDYMFRFSFKNAKGEEVAYATHKEAAPTDIAIPAKANIELGENNAAATYEVTVTGTGAAANALENVTWTLTDGEGYVTIPEDSTGATVTLTATAATTEDVTVTLTATLVIGETTYTKTCTVTVRENGAKPTKPASTFDVALDSSEPTYGEHYFHFTTSNVPDGFSFAYVKVYKNDETTGTQRWAQYDNGHLRIYVTDAANAFDGDWKFEFYDGTGAVCATVYFTYPVPTAG